MHVNGFIDWPLPVCYNSCMVIHPLLEKAKQAATDSGLTYQEIGERMGYPTASARQSVWQFLHSTQPSLEMLVKYANAIGVKARDLL